MYLQYRLYNNSDNNTSNVIAEVLKNRGIEDYKKYLHLDESVVIPYENLENIDKAVELFMQHFNQKNKIEILVDEDPDGFCSAAMMYLYIKYQVIAMKGAYTRVTILDDAENEAMKISDT